MPQVRWDSRTARPPDDGERRYLVLAAQAQPGLPVPPGKVGVTRCGCAPGCNFPFWNGLKVRPGSGYQSG